MKNADEMRKLKAEKGESVIPKGDYCYCNIRMSDRKTEEGLQYLKQIGVLTGIVMKIGHINMMATAGL